MVAPIDDNQTAILEEALTRFIDDYLRDEHPDIEEFIAQYPECEAQLKERIQDLQEIYTLFDSLVHADESDFEDSVIESNLIGRRIRSFEITKVIGRGGMGVVYLARDAKLERQVAIKSMPTGLLSSSKAQARFKSEAKLLASLNHPNIAVIYDIIEDQEGASYLVLEYVPGETLTERIAREPLGLEDALSIGGQIAEAVSAAHKKGIIHRDLKPGNIKITPEDRVKVLDFGLAKTYDRDNKDSETAAIQPDRIIGTPAYMSPEQAQGRKTDHRTDIWSFGCIMFEMLTGRHPFECESAKDTLERIIEHQPYWNLLPESIPTNIRTLLKHCLDKDPSRRLEDISEAAKEMQQTLSKLAMAPSAKLLRLVMIIVVMITIFGLSGLALLFTSDGQYPSKNRQANAYYSRGIEYSSRPYQDQNDLKIAKEMYEKAISLDDKFALAYAWLSHTYSGMYNFSYDRTEECIAKAKEAVDKALVLDPKLPEAHWALGVYYYWCRSEYTQALEELEIARKKRPNNSRLLATIGHVQRRQGKFEEALTNYRRAFDLDPQSSSRAGDIASTLRCLRRYQEAAYYYDKAISLAPDEDYNHFVKATLYLIWKGSTVEARAVLDNASKYFNLEDKQRFVNLLFDLDIIERNYQGALARLPLYSQTTDTVGFTDALRYARIYGYMNEIDLAERYYDDARNILESKVDEDPNNALFHSMLGIAYAGLGRKKDAIKEGERAVKLLPYTKDTGKGFALAKDLAIIYTMVGEYDAAIDQIVFLLSVPGESSISLLQCYPTWDPLRDHPRFKKLINAGKS